MIGGMTPDTTTFTDWLSDRARERDAAGLHRETVVRGDARPEHVVDLASNDYLGLRRHPRVIDAARAAAGSGGGAGASRLVTGTLPIHAELEDRLAALVGTPAALVLSTGYHANLAATTALADADTLIVSDAHCHASLIDGMRLSRGSVQVARHRDLGHVEELLTARVGRDGEPRGRAMVVVESVYSVLGDAAPLVELADLCAEHDAVLLVDDAHGLGVRGADGAGLVAGSGIAGRPHVVVTTTLSKSLGSQGGAVLGTGLVREHLVNTARPFIYDTGLAPAAAGAALGSLDVLADEPWRCARVREVAARLAEVCGVDEPAGAVLSVPMPGPDEAVAAVAEAGERGVRIGCFRPPSTPDGISRLRFTAHAGITDEDLETVAQVLAGVVGTTGDAA